MEESESSSESEDEEDDTQGWLLDDLSVGCVAQWSERWSLTGGLCCPRLDLQLTGDHVCG